MNNNYKDGYICIVGPFEDKDAKQKYAQAERDLVNAGFRLDRIFNPVTIFNNCPTLSVDAKVSIIIKFLELCQSAYLLADSSAIEYCKQANYLIHCPRDNKLKTFTNVNDIN